MKHDNHGKTQGVRKVQLFLSYQVKKKLDRPSCLIPLDLSQWPKDSSRQKKKIIFFAKTVQIGCSSGSVEKPSESKGTWLSPGP
jgi:hypothetical protein